MKSWSYSTALLLALSYSLSACGHFPRTKDVNEAGSDQPEPGSPVLADQPGNTPVGGNPEVTPVAHPTGSADSSTSAVPPGFDRAQDRTAPSAFYQRDASLSDLFSAKSGQAGESMLCWPAALAYQARYQLDHSQSKLPKLSSILDPGADAATDVRKLTSLCKVDLEEGTTVPKGASCIDEMYKEAGYTASINVIGVDAMWSTYGMYPKNTGTEHRTATLADVMSALDQDKSLIVLVGFYQLDESGKAWKRASGHFVSITGYEYKAAWGEDAISLHVVNPAVKPDAPTEAKFQSIAVSKMQVTDKTPALPSKTAYELTGTGLSYRGYTTVLESLIVFSASAP